MGESAITSENYFARFQRWIDMDSEAEAVRLAERRKLQSREACQRTGDTLLGLVIVDYRTGLGGRYLFTLRKKHQQEELPWTRLKAGSPVIVSETRDPDEAICKGVVSSRNAASIQIATEQWLDGDLFDLDLASDEVTRNRERAALAAVDVARGRVAELRRILLADCEPSGRGQSPRFAQELPEITLPHLNDSQRAAVAFALSARDVAIIHGPPGTGKTTSVVAFMCEAVARGEKILACAPSNTGVDNLLERLAACGQNVVRLGHPARVKSDLQRLTLDAQVDDHPEMKIANKLHKEAEVFYRQAGKTTRGKPPRGARQRMREEARQLKNEARRIERSVVKGVLDRADVICSTNTVDDESLHNREFDWVVIDEACQSTEPSCWIPIQRGDRLLLAGDHCQLPPTIISREAEAEGYGISLMERLVETYGDHITRQLTVQYRMHEMIMSFPSRQFYDETLQADESVASHRLVDLPGIDPDPLLEHPVTFLDTAGADYSEELEPEGSSRRNPQEGALVLQMANLFLSAGVDAEDIAIIAPYAAQVRWFRLKSPHARLEIDTVDGFQGREKEVTILSLVRSNRTGEIGFLGDTRRMNVALTRARRKLLVVGDSATLGGHPFYASLLDFFSADCEYRSVWDLM